MDKKRKKLSTYIFVGTFCLSKPRKIEEECKDVVEIKKKPTASSRSKIRDISKPLYYSFEFVIKKEEGTGIPTAEEGKEVVKSKVKEVDIYDIEITHLRLTTHTEYLRTNERLKYRKLFK